LASIPDNNVTTVLIRNFPEPAPRLDRVMNVFAPWRTTR
jgi:hypothetical protein